MAKLHYPDIITKEPKFKALADLSVRLSQQEVRQIMTTLVDLLDDSYIELLAEKWSADGDDGLFFADTIQSKRDLIKRAIELHRHKGTPWSVRDVLRQLGFGEIEIDEGLKARDYSGHTIANQIPEDERWAYYAIRLRRPVTNAQALNVRKILRRFTPARCSLAVLDYKAVPILYNNKIRYNGQYNHGAA